MAGATVVSVFAAFPHALIAGLAGLALYGAINDALVRSVSDAKDRDAGLFTFLVTASGVSFSGLVSTVLGLAAGVDGACGDAQAAPGQCGRNIDRGLALEFFAAHPGCANTLQVWWLTLFVLALQRIVVENRKACLYLSQL